jgi:hypothetical protein
VLTEQLVDITWPIGQEAIVKFARHDSLGATEVFPRSFLQRIDRCGQMVSGVVSSTSGLNVAFCGRKEAGTYTLEHAPKGFQGAHGSRHLYNMLGGKAYEVDFLFARPSAGQEVGEQSSLVLKLPSTEKNGVVNMIISPQVESILKHALDCLPWNTLSWSLHRGLRDILLAYSKPVMDAHRKEFAGLLAKTVADKSALFAARGWDPAFVRDHMAQMGASAVLAGKGNSGDSVRVVTDIVWVMVGDWEVSRMDDVSFWRKSERSLDLEGIVALTKVFVLEWSQEFDYQMYHNIPLSLYFG